MEIPIFVCIAFCIPTKADFNHIVGLRKFPGIAVKQPIIGAFNLPAVLKGLVENTVLVADAITNTRDPHRG